MDAVSYSHSAKQAQRIEKFIKNPDSNSGIVTVPKVIGAGESVTIPTGRMAVLPNIQVDGTLNIEGEVFIPSGSSVDFSTGIKVNGEKLTMSIPTAYHIYNGSVEATNTEITNGFSTTLYTGNGGIQAINTGVDMATQWGDDASEQFGGLVWTKCRSTAISNILIDTIRGNKSIFSNETSVESSTSRLTSFNNKGFTLTSDTSINANLDTYVSWNFQTTHRKTGVTNHGKPYTCHYNPYTGFTIVKYEGSGIAGHEIPHHLGRKLGFVTVKNLSVVENWMVQYDSTYYLHLNLINATTPNPVVATLTNDYSIMSANAGYNTSGNSYILYGWANSYLDESNKLIGNYEIGVYQGTGVAGNKVKTRGKPAWVMVKRLDSTGNWVIADNLRPLPNGFLCANLSNAEVGNIANFFYLEDNGINVNQGNADTNASGGQYLYMVVYDNDSGSGKSKYPKATDTTNLSINALVPYANGIDVNGSKVSIEYKNETITGLTLTQGKNYVYSKNDGTYGVSSIAPSYGTDNPLAGDFFNLKTLKWYDSSNAEITPRTYLDCIVYADHNGQVSYVEELPKTTYFDEVKANEFKGKNACTAWVVFDGTTTPPTIKDSYNVSAVIKVVTGIYDIYYKDNMDNINYSGNVTVRVPSASIQRYLPHRSLNKFTLSTFNDTGTSTDANDVTIQIFGGKN